MTADRLFNVQRHERLLNELRRSGAVRVRDLARALGVSEMTIRRDIAELAERNMVTKVHGGATLPESHRQGRPARVCNGLTIGMVVPSLDYYWPAVIAGAWAAAGALGVDLQLRGSSYDPDEDRRQIGRLVDAGQVHGLLLAPSLANKPHDEILEWIDNLAVPAILVERQPQRGAPSLRHLEWVRTDHALGMEMAVQHLHQHGHRRIGLVLSRGSPTSPYLMRGWRMACADLGISEAMVIRESVALDRPGRREIIEGILAECRRARITALVIHSDADAIAVARILTELGVSIPDELALVSYDDEIAHLAEPSLTSVRPPKEHVGRLAVELIVARLMEGARRPAQRILVAPGLTVRASSAPRTFRA